MLGSIGWAMMRQLVTQVRPWDDHADWLSQHQSRIYPLLHKAGIPETTNRAS